MRDLPVDDEAHLLYSCPATAVAGRVRRFARLPFRSLQDLMCCCDGYGVASTSVGASPVTFLLLLLPLPLVLLLLVLLLLLCSLP
jgi:hypothetical protein